MERRIVVSGGNELRTFSLPQLCPLQRVCLEGAGPLAAGGDALYCACNPGGAIWRLSPDTLMPQALFSGGPGVCALALSADGRRLHALCGEGDSVLMLDAAGGQPLMLARAGVNPQGFCLCGDTLAVAGGESAALLLLEEETLALRAQIPMPGPVMAAALSHCGAYALCLSEKLASIFVSSDQSGSRKMEIAGLPGALAAAQGGVYAATDGRLYTCREGGIGVPLQRNAPGRAGRIVCIGGRLFLCDAYGGGLLSLSGGGCWKRICMHALDVAEL